MLKVFLKSYSNIKKLLTILFFSLLFSGTSYADSHCTDERKAWVEYFKVDFAKNFEEVIYTDEK